MLSHIDQTTPLIIKQILIFAFLCAIIGPASFIIGQSLPRSSFNSNARPYKSFRFERGGKIYAAIKVQSWKDIVPDMSKYIKSTFRKKLGLNHDEKYISDLIQETCVAEFVHYMLIGVSPIFLLTMQGAYGITAMIIYILGNVPFVIIQRYNRPRLQILMERHMRRNASKQGAGSSASHVTIMETITNVKRESI